jgi:hypothetical protein
MYRDLNQRQIQFIKITSLYGDMGYWQFKKTKAGQSLTVFKNENNTQQEGISCIFRSILKDVVF